MKGIKVYNIEWDLTDVENKEKVMKTLPDSFGMRVTDSFNVVSEIPVKLKKKYGFDIITFCFDEYHIARSTEELLKMSIEDNEKDIFTPKGNLSAYGSRCLSGLEANILWRKRLEEKGLPATKMPKILDEMMLSLEHITGLTWEKDGSNKMMKVIYDDLHLKVPMATSATATAVATI